MNPKVAARQARLLRMLESKQEIRIGREQDCPLSVAKLVRLKEDHPAVLKVYRHGLTAEVFHLKVEGHHWCLKRRRHDSLVANVDGRTAFLTELERRREIEALRELHPTILANVVCTCFGSARAGVLVSPWLRGVPVHELNERNLAQMLAVQAELAHWGWFDWDPSPGNLLDDGQQISVFDFGYMWPFDPRHEFNSNGLTDPAFHVPERLETRTLSGLWLDEPDPLPQFRYWRGLCINWAQRELQHLTREGASAPVLARLQSLLGEWRSALASEEALAANWWRDMYRSHRLDIADDLSGKSCGLLTLRRLDWLQQAVTEHFAELVDNLGPDEAGLSQAALLSRLEGLREEIRANLLPVPTLVG
ncbi:protein kinase family protein [Aeromonas hydrophila]|uniref:hypothetical protein n=1 Tax=Aeromonas hydrophila TaxID=644 RepID=UPI0007607F8D|nr:hypothetical protein [Aeromonas hydrophila]KWR67276.1 hypothetical protein ATO50_14535 [Aeromonas hydrophila]HAU4930000.1 hypothetical protein [Aeromonas hydrophila]